MAQLTRKRYPVGLQTFSELREKNYVYIDKTAYVYEMAHADAKYLFLSRPRRFGKSLLTSTLRSYFEGRKKLFEGLAIEQLETEWTAYPVLHFDMSTAKHVGEKQLVEEINGKLVEYEKIYGRDESHVNLNQRMEGLIKHAYEQIGEQVVVLIDEYDAPLLDVMHEEENLPVLRNVMRNFYSPLKACDPYLRFVFLTGITKFSQLSIFSELNNINISKEAMLEKLKENYDGYHFTWPSPDIYNPYSLMNAFSKGKIDSYWFGSGTPTYLIEMLRKYGMTPIQLGGEMKAGKEEFDAPTERLTSVVPLLYQSGYITIKDGNPWMEMYTLGIPNREVRIGLMKSLVPYYLTPNTFETSSALIRMTESLYKDDMESMLQQLQTPLRGSLPAGTLRDIQSAGYVHGCGSSHVTRSNKRGNAHSLYLIYYRTETGQGCRHSHAAD